MSSRRSSSLDITDPESTGHWSFQEGLTSPPADQHSKGLPVGTWVPEMKSILPSAAAHGVEPGERVLTNATRDSSGHMRMACSTARARSWTTSFTRGHRAGTHAQGSRSLHLPRSQARRLSGKRVRKNVWTHIHTGKTRSRGGLPSVAEGGEHGRSAIAQARIGN